MVDLESRVDALSNVLHRQAENARTSVVWLALDGATPEQQERSELRHALLAHTPIRVPIEHPHVDGRLWPSWYRLDLAHPGDGAILHLSLTLALLELQSQALRAGNGREVAGWLLLPAGVEPEHAAMHAGRQMIQRHQGRDMLLRTHDPSALWWLWRFIDDTQRAALLGTLRQWCLLSPLGELESLTAPVTGDDRGLSLPEAQWQEVLAVAALNKALRDLPERPTEPSIFDIMRLALHRAWTNGLTDPGDLALFVRHAVQVHPQFDAHPLLRERLHRRQPDEFYAAVAADLDDADWRKVQRDCLHFPVSE